MTKEKIIAQLNKHRPAFLNALGCTIMDVDTEKSTCTMEFNITKDYCHSGNIIQGGFVTAMLDAVTSHAVFAMNPAIQVLSTLELKVSFYKASHDGKLKAIGRIDKMGRSIAFLSGDLYNEDNVRTASITSTAKVFIPKS